LGVTGLNGLVFEQSQNYVRKAGRSSSARLYHVDFSPPLHFRSARNDDGNGIAALIARIFQDYENCPFVWDEFPELKAPADHYKKLGGELFVLDEKQSDGTSVIVGSLALTRTHHPATAQLFKV